MLLATPLTVYTIDGGIVSWLLECFFASLLLAELGDGTGGCGSCSHHGCRDRVLLVAPWGAGWFFFSFIYGIIEYYGWKRPTRSPGSTPTHPHHTHWLCPLSATSPLFLNTSSDSDSLTSLGSLSHCLSTPPEKNVFLISYLNLPGITWGPDLSFCNQPCTQNNKSSSDTNKKSRYLCSHSKALQQQILYLCAPGGNPLPSPWGKEVPGGWRREGFQRFLLNPPLAEWSRRGP